MKNRSLYVVLVVVMALALSGCSTAAKFPMGKFVAENNPAVTWEFRPDGSYSNKTAKGLPVEGNYKVDGSTYTDTYDNVMVSDVENCNKYAAYTWSYTGGKLTFTVADDKCQERIERYTSAAFVPQK